MIRRGHSTMYTLCAGKAVALALEDAPVQETVYAEPEQPPVVLHVEVEPEPVPVLLPPAPRVSWLARLIAWVRCHARV